MLDFVAEPWFVEALIFIALSTVATLIACWFVDQFNKDN
jgi:hypothetical protein